MPHAQGGFVEYLLMRDDQVRPLPAGMPLRQGLAEQLGVALHALSRAGQVSGRRCWSTAPARSGCSRRALRSRPGPRRSG